MSTPVLIFVVAVAAGTVVALVFTLLYVVTSLKRFTGQVREFNDDLKPQLERLSAEAEVARSELERVSEAATELGGPGAGT